MIPKHFTPEPDLLAGRVILITGASGGLGAALARECARAGASVILSGRNGAGSFEDGHPAGPQP